MANRMHTRSLAAFPGLKMAIVSSGFGLLLSAAVLSGSFMMHASAHQPSLETELRQMRGVSTADMDTQDDGYTGVSASILASQAAEQTREMSAGQATRTAVVTHHHERGAI